MQTIIAPQKTLENCPVCQPVKYIKTVCTFVEQVDDVADEYLYQCDNCEAKIWIAADWAHSNKVTNLKENYESMKEVYQSLTDFS